MRLLRRDKNIQFFHRIVGEAGKDFHLPNKIVIGQ